MLIKKKKKEKNECRMSKSRMCFAKSECRISKSRMQLGKDITKRHSIRDIFEGDIINTDSERKRNHAHKPKKSENRRIGHFDSLSTLDWNAGGPFMVVPRFYPLRV